MTTQIALPEPVLDAHRSMILCRLQRLIRRFGGLMIALNVLLPAGLAVYSVTAGEAYWYIFRRELAPLEWFSSVQLLLIAAVAHLNYLLAGYLQGSHGADTARHRWVWLILALGFVLFSLDERFDIHEALRDDLFRPLGVFEGVPWLIDGEIGLYLFFAVGLIFTPFLWRQLRISDLALGLFVAALILTLPSIVIDSLTDIEHWPMWRFWDYAFEEVGEAWAQLLFLLSFLVVLHTRLERLKGERGN